MPTEGSNDHSGGPEFAVDQRRLQQLNRGETVVIDTSEAVNLPFDRVWLQPRRLTEHERKTRVAGRNHPEVVCLCGSTRFKEEYLEEQGRLTMEGKIFLTVGFFGHSDDVDLSTEQMADLDRLHKRKIDLSNRVHVIDVGGYIGESTRSEIEYAERNGIPVTYYSETNDLPATGGDNDA